jgi:N-acetylneuraminic acid mutarotase
MGKDMVIAGGCNMGGHVATVTRIKADGSSEALPELPTTIAYPAFVQVKGKLYVFGGQEKAESVTCLSSSYALDLQNPDAGWKELAPMPGEGRMLAAAGACHKGKIYVAGGCSLHPDAKGAAERTYLKSTLCYDPATNTWSTAADMPETIVAPATPMPAMRGGLLLLCGDPGNFYRASLEGKAPADHPGQNTTIYSYDPCRNAWTVAGQNSIGIATAPAVKVMGTVFIISGETHPGVRTPVISTLNLSK